MKRLVVSILVLLAGATIARGDPIHDIARAQELNLRIHNFIPYVVSKDEILNPLDTLANGGDCADMSALLVSLLEADGIPAELILLDLENIEPHHAYVRVWGMYFDPVTGTMSSETYPLLHKVTYEVSLKNILFAPRRDKNLNNSY